MLYKNWDDDVFIFGDSITIDRRSRNFKQRFYRIHDICASHYLSILFPPAPIWPKLDIFLQTCVDEAGFNEKVLEKVLQRFTKTRDKAWPLLK
ncbi:MAG: hypothetical protein ISS26_00005 [Candidatus Omnitrophica bacterium]|nr:hypothetical protein [Candidatus Omnitrophota bacterium]